MKSAYERMLQEFLPVLVIMIICLVIIIFLLNSIRKHLYKLRIESLYKIDMDEIDLNSIDKANKKTKKKK